VRWCVGCGCVKMSNLAAAKQAIIATIAGSSVPEDPTHAENTLEWLLKLNPHADDALQIAALGHDIDRACASKVNRAAYANYDLFKAAHAKNSAQILKELLEKYKVSASIIEKVVNLVVHHEVGGYPEADQLKDADSISYFDGNLELYYQREGWQETKRRAQWGYQRLSPKMKEVLREFHYKSQDLNRLLQEVISEFESQENKVNHATTDYQQKN